MNKTLFFRTSHLTITCLLLLSLNVNLLGQKDNQSVTEKRSFADRLSFGGGLGLSFGTYSTLIDVSPIIGYSVTDDFMAGIGLTYKYYRYKDYYYNINDRNVEDYKTNMYGASVWARYFLIKTEIPVIENVFLHAEVEPLIFTTQYSLNPLGDYQDPFGNLYIRQKDQITLTGVFFGGGLMQPIGGRSFMYLEVLWNFNEDLYSPYSNPRIRIGISVGL